MTQGPLTEKELEWLDDIFMKYGDETSVLDVSGLDGLLTAILSGPVMAEPDQWLVAVWGGADKVPRWRSEREMERFMTLTFQHMDDIDQRLTEYQDQFEPLFGVREMEGQEFTIVEEWCFGYMRGVALGRWPELPESLQPAFEAIALHGKEENFDRLETLTPEEYDAAIEIITPSALALYNYWLALRTDHPPQVVSQPFIAEVTAGRNDPCPCGSGKKFKQCCLH
ncbi:MULTISPECIES: YecA family protein [Tatumella]|uniref:YecA family protein n=1 Tax=Tatumella punctata TaxID=399969 RepID=A0ABW1VTK4_9GAMM|nr:MULTISPECIES: YecA family protein [unclassified Tatumella]MBS0857427.1 YecA family protein [Tatumella sp. JGM16]MBS0877806.1 YecA family protein [Tatumella sp. JGM82]MBS0891511.1 YecA family protein [Tatumella sp. JGM94]MBS0894402.1 YecA family protein [Tatumella sp. JGM130]MBS0902441.1 YecA family protein [Tatumella sp. JGM100]